MFMWSESKQKRLSELRKREQEAILTDEEQLPLKELLYELDEEERQNLQPALERMRQEKMDMLQDIEIVCQQNEALKEISKRQDALLIKAKPQPTTLVKD
jgi:hypothetical protein